MRSDVTDAQHRRRRRRRGLLLALAISIIASLALAPGAFADFLTPKSGGSPNADAIHSLYKIVLYIAIVEEAERRHAEIIYLGTEHAPASERALGPTASYLLAHRPCRVVIETPPASGPHDGRG